MQTIVALLLLAASPDAGTATTTTEPVAAKPVKEKKVCRSIVATGTRLGKRECKTQAEWDMVDKDLNLRRGGARSTG
ncbi:MAG TPA: hypothetical protein VGN36_09215 [Sphingorhabdus sp.]|jgi:hypothetical protein|nr:hypothetical protein [Sphingorhabdus sp.]